MSQAPSAAPASPARPAAVPADAVWEEQLNEWVQSGRDAAGARDGEARSWRADGTLAGACAYRDGVLHGAWRRFHPDGALAREATFRDGRMQGRMTAYGHDGPTPEPLQSCCVPPGAWQLQIDYVDGGGAGQRWYDRAGVHILPSGNPYPPRPDSVPAEAFYEEEAERWVQAGRIEDGQSAGVWLRWSTGGVLRERDELQAGKAHGRWQRFDERGEITEDGEWRAGLRDGSHRRVGLGPDLYADPAVVEERGHFAAGLAAGVWTLHGADGEALRRCDLGAAAGEDELRASPALGAPRPQAAWEAEAEALEAAGRLTEAVLAAARATAAGAGAEPLRLLLARRTPALTEAGAADLATVARADGKLAPIANALVRGGDAAALLRAVAAALPGNERAALDFADAALLLAPDRHDCRITRALVQVHLGNPAAARADAAALPEGWEEQRSFLETYTRVIYPEFGFWPARAEIETLFPEVPPGPEQPVEAVRAVIQKYATRLGAVRAELVARAKAGGAAGAEAWLPPDLAASLLPDGPAPLEAWEFEEVVVEDEAAEGEEAAAPGDNQGEGASGRETASEGEPTLVKVDERLTIDPEHTIPSLMRLARREWNALAWLCWAAGLDRIALPDRVAPPETFGHAAAMTLERVWRCRDKLSTSGLRALTRGIPGFVWEGMEIDVMPALLVEICTEEYVELRALFYWLCDAGIQSPWQDNLRAEG